MKGIIIYEDYRGKKVVEAIKLDEVDYTCKSASSDDGWINELSGIRKESTQAYCNESDTYDFETGALIALMKMCGSDKVVRACNEAFSYEKELIELRKDNNNLREANKGLQEEIKRLKGESEKRWKNYQRNIQKKQDRINELEAQIKVSEDDKLKNIEYYEKEIKRLNASICAKGVLNGKLLKDYNTAQSAYEVMVEKSTDLMDKVKKLEEENEKLKLDCEKLQHGYIDTDMLFCGGRQNGKQYTFLVDLFKKLDQKKVDAAYKEAYNKWIAQPIWQKEVFKQIHKDQLASLLEAGKYLYKLTTKREEMWEKIFALHKEGDVIIKVKREDINTFLHEIENKIPEITWASGDKIFEAKYTIKDIFKELEGCDTPYEIYFRLWKVNKLSYSSDQYIYPSYEFKHIDYLPPMRWDLFKKGRIVIKVEKENYGEFCSRMFAHFDKVGVHAFNHDCKFGYFAFNKDTDYVERVLSSDCGQIKDIKRRKIVDWEDVRENKTTMEDPYDTWSL